MKPFRLGLVALAATASFTPPLPAAVLVVGNYTGADVTLTVTEADKETHAVKVAALQVSPVTVSGPVDVRIETRTGPKAYRLEPYNAYVVVVDKDDGRRLEGIELPGEPLAEDAKAGEKPAKAVPVTFPVTLLVDDADPRTDKIWQGVVRRRFDQAAAAVEAHSGVRFEFKGFGTWKADGAAFDVPGLLDDFEAKVKVKAGEVAVGYTSRRIEEKDKAEVPFGLTKGLLARHVLMREWRPKSEPERVEALTHVLAQLAGAVLSPDPESVMRPKVANGLALATGYRTRFDPLNTLAMSIWGEELRRGPRGDLASVTPANKARLARVYKALAAAVPDDRRAMNYINDLEAGVAGAAPRPKEPGKGADPSLPPLASRSPQQEAIRKVVRAVGARARENADAADKIRGDALTAAYVRAAAAAAAGVEENFRPSAFAAGLGVALDDAGVLRDDPLTGPVAKAVETDGERQERLAVLGLPTLRGRRDLCQRFAVAAATADLIGPSVALEGGIGRSKFDLHRPVGFGFGAVAADVAGADFAEAIKKNPELIGKLKQDFDAADYLPSLVGLRDGLSEERFEQDFGDNSDPRFVKVIDDIKARVAKLPAYGK